MTKLSLTDREWKEFFIKQLFQTFKGTKGLQTHTGSFVSKDNLKLSTTPRITVRDTNNGIDSFCTSNDRNFRIFENIISVSFLGSVFYHPYLVSLDMKVHALIPINFSLNKYTSKFLIPSIKNCINSLSYGNQLSSTDLPKVKILLPINNSGNPDWQFMEDYIKQIEKEKIQEIVNYYQNKLLGCLINNQIRGSKTYIKKWKSFKIGDYFTFIRGNQNNMAQCQQGNIPLVSARKMDNGIKDFIADNGKKLFQGHIISLNNDGDGGVGLAYYQPTITALDTHVTALIPKIEFSKNILLFISLTISLQKNKFSHGYSINNNRLNAQNIMLPIDEQGNPDWRFMEEYIKSIEYNKIQAILQHLNDNHSQHSTAQHSTAQRLWMEFSLSQVFNIKSGVRLTKSEMIDGDLPFIGATEFDNGITEFVNNTNNSLDKNILGVNYNGSVVENFYHPYECIFSDDVKRLELKNQDHANRWVYLFLKTILLQQKEKYQYGYKFNAKRMAKQSIMLPIDNHREPNWAYIENHIKQIELNHILSIIRYYQTKLK